MIKILRLKKFELKKIKVFIFFSFVSIWLSVSTEFNDLLIFQNHKSLDYIDLVNFIRHFSVYVIFIISLLVILKNKVKVSFFNKLFIFFFVLQCIGLFITNNLLENFSYSISSISFILTIILLGHYFNSSEINTVILLMSLILLIISLLSFLPNLMEYISGKGSLYGASFDKSKIFFEKLSPRSSGISRSLLIILILNFYFHNNYRKKELFFLINTILITFILFNQSRVIIFLLFIFLIFIFFGKGFNLKSFLKLSVYFVLLPILLFYTVGQIHKYNLKNYSLKIISQKEKIPTKTEMIEIEKELRDRPIIRNISLENFSSGRTNDWISLLREFDYKNALFGYGAMADRHLINQSASNALIYTFSSSGILGIIIFIILLILKLITIFKNLVINKNNINNERLFLTTIVLFILLRSIFETSYALFGIDFLVLSLIYNVISKSEGY